MKSDIIKQELSNSDDFNNDTFTDDNINWIGIVVNIDDPDFEGKCKVRVFGKWDDLKDEDLPWCYPYNSIAFSGGKGGAGTFSTPKKGHIVNVIFDHNDDYAPQYTNLVGINNKLQSELKQSYTNAQVISYDEDEDLKIIYTQKNGLMLWFKESYVNIDNSQHIKVFHKGGPSKIDLIDGNITEFSKDKHYINSPAVVVGKDGTHPDTKCDELFSMLSKLAKAIDSKLPASPGVSEGLVNAYKLKVCSDIVNIA